MIKADPGCLQFLKTLETLTGLHEAAQNLQNVIATSDSRLNIELKDVRLF